MLRTVGPWPSHVPSHHAMEALTRCQWYVSSLLDKLRQVTFGDMRLMLQWVRDNGVWICITKSGALTEILPRAQRGGIKILSKCARPPFEWSGSRDHMHADDG